MATTFLQMSLSLSMNASEPLGPGVWNLNPTHTHTTTPLITHNFQVTVRNQTLVPNRLPGGGLSPEPSRGVMGRQNVWSGCRRHLCSNDTSGASSGAVLLLLSEHNIRELLSRRNTQQVGLHEGQKEEEEEEQQLQSSE